MTDLENLQKQENEAEAESHQRSLEIMEQITELFMQLSPIGQADLLDVLSEEDYDEEDDDA